MRIVLLGPPGSGKGTQGEYLEEDFHLPRLSVGALIRRQWKEKTPEGREAEKYMLQGEAVPAELYVKILTPWLLSYKEGFIIDNLIRTDEQLDAYKKFEQANNFRLTNVFYLRLSEEESIRRLHKRKFEKDRPDETPEAIHRRFSTFFTHMNIILDYFAKENILVEIDAERSKEEVHKDIMDQLQKEHFI